jgi:hypothetical protein
MNQIVNKYNIIFDKMYKFIRFLNTSIHKNVSKKDEESKEINLSTLDKRLKEVESNLFKIVSIKTEIQESMEKFLDEVRKNHSLYPDNNDNKPNDFIPTNLTPIVHNESKNKKSNLNISDLVVIKTFSEKSTENVDIDLDSVSFSDFKDFNKVTPIMFKDPVKANAVLCLKMFCNYLSKDEHLCKIYNSVDFQEIITKIANSIAKA